MPSSGMLSDGDLMELANTEPTLDLHSPERAVFVTDDNRRARRLRHGAFVAAFAACLWLVGLGVGMLGLGGLPGISLGKAERAGSDPARPGAGAPVSELGPGTNSPIARSLGARRQVVDARRQNQRRHGSQSRSGRAPARPASPVTTTPVSAPAPQQPVNPAQRQRGWTRKGYVAPPGQVRKTEPQPPAGSRGQRRGQTTTTTTTTPLPLGQAKNAPPQPPPPSEG